MRKATGSLSERLLIWVLALLFLLYTKHGTSRKAVKIFILKFLIIQQNLEIILVVFIQNFCYFQKEMIIMKRREDDNREKRLILQHHFLISVAFLVL